MLCSLVALTVITMAFGCFAANILVFLPLKIRTHYIQVEPIFRTLAIRGHNVTEVSPYSPKNKIPNLHHVLLSVDTLSQVFAHMDAAAGAQNGEGALSFNNKMIGLSEVIALQILESPVFTDLIHGRNKFDLVFTEYFMQQAFVVLGHIFNAPVITYSSVGYYNDIFRFSGALNAPAYIPYKIGNYVSHAGSTGLKERLDNTWVQYAITIHNEYWYYPVLDDLLSRYIEKPLPHVTDMLRNISMFFLTADNVIDGAKLYPPNILEISGLHIRDPEPLDEELKLLMDTSKFGVIYFSFGTIVNSANFKENNINVFLTVFKELKQIVLWKANMDTSGLDIPKNVYIRDWFNQISVLAHPNCLLFLTHGGISSMMEAIKYAVPVVGMPFIADQDINIANAEYYGYGLRLFYKNLTEQSLRWAIKTTLQDRRFEENISRASRIFADKPITSLDTAVYWIEYVIRHKGAHHLKPLTVQMPWYQILLLDVMAVYLTAISATLALIIAALTLIFKKAVEYFEKSKIKIN